MFQPIFKGMECPVCHNGLLVFDKGLPVFKKETVKLRKQNSVTRLCAVIIRPEEVRAADATRLLQKRFQITVLSNRHVELMKKYFTDYGMCKEKVMKYFSAKGIPLSFVFEKLEWMCPFLEKCGKNMDEIFYHFLTRKRSVECLWKYLNLLHLYYTNEEYREKLRKWKEKNKPIPYVLLERLDVSKYLCKTVEKKNYEEHAHAQSKETCNKLKLTPVVVLKRLDARDFLPKMQKGERTLTKSGENWTKKQRKSVKDAIGKPAPMTDKCETNTDALLRIGSDKISDGSIENNETFEREISCIRADAKSPETAEIVADGSLKNSPELKIEDGTETAPIMLDNKDLSAEQSLQKRLSDFEGRDNREKKRRRGGGKEILAQDDAEFPSQSEIKQQISVHQPLNTEELNTSFADTESFGNENCIIMSEEDKTDHDESSELKTSDTTHPFRSQQCQDQSSIASPNKVNKRKQAEDDSEERSRKRVLNDEIWTVIDNQTDDETFEKEMEEGYSFDAKSPETAKSDEDETPSFGNESCVTMNDQNKTKDLDESSLLKTLDTSSPFKREEWTGDESTLRAATPENKEDGDKNQLEINGSGEFNTVRLTDRSKTEEMNTEAETLKFESDSESVMDEVKQQMHETYKTRSEKNEEDQSSIVSPSKTNKRKEVEEDSEERPRKRALSDETWTFDENQKVDETWIVDGNDTDGEISTSGCMVDEIWIIKENQYYGETTDDEEMSVDGSWPVDETFTADRHQTVFETFTIVENQTIDKTRAADRNLRDVEVSSTDRNRMLDENQMSHTDDEKVLCSLLTKSFTPAEETSHKDDEKGSQKEADKESQKEAAKGSEKETEKRALQMPKKKAPFINKASIEQLPFHENSDVSKVKFMQDLHANEDDDCLPEEEVLRFLKTFNIAQQSTCTG